MNWIALLILFFGVSCSHQRSYISEDEKAVKRITKITAQKLEILNGLVCIGTGAQMMYEIIDLYMGFNYYHEIDIERGRKLIIEAIDQYLVEINGCEQIRKRLSHYPFDPRNIHIGIYIYKHDRSDVDTEKLSIVSAYDGKISYKVVDKAGQIQVIFEESYDEAVKKLKLGGKNEAD